MKPEPTAADLLRRSRLAAGAALICLLAAAETVVAHHARPNPWSVWIWALLGSAGAAALLASLWFRHRWQRSVRAAALKDAHPAAAPATTTPP